MYTVPGGVYRTHIVFTVFGVSSVAWWLISESPQYLARCMVCRPSQGYAVCAQCLLSYAVNSVSWALKSCACSSTQGPVAGVHVVPGVRPADACRVPGVMRARVHGGGVQVHSGRED